MFRSLPLSHTTTSTTTATEPLLAVNRAAEQLSRGGVGSEPGRGAALPGRGRLRAGRGEERMGGCGGAVAPQPTVVLCWDHSRLATGPRLKEHKTIISG